MKKTSRLYERNQINIPSHRLPFWLECQAPDKGVISGQTCLSGGYFLVQGQYTLEVFVVGLYDLYGM